VRYVNAAYRRSGTLWEGRHKGVLVESESYLLTCYRYIELNPVRANMVAHPAEYRHFSYRAHAFGEPDPLVRDHLLYTQLGTTPTDRRRAYRALFHTPLDETTLHGIREATQYGVPLGNERFRTEIEAALGRRVGYAQRGRPKKRTAAVATS
jgi:putative transposase